MATDDFFAVLDVMPGRPAASIARLQSRYRRFHRHRRHGSPHQLHRQVPAGSPATSPSSRTSHIVFCGDKSILRADYLIDDNPRQLQLFQEPGRDDHTREGILYTSPANIEVTGFRRVDNWLDIERLFLSD